MIENWWKSLEKMQNDWKIIENVEKYPKKGQMNEWLLISYRKIDVDFGTFNDALGWFGGAAGRVDEGNGGVFGRPPESFGAASVELGNGNGEGQPRVTLDGADLEAAAGTPVGAALRSSDGIDEFRTELADDVDFEGADGRVARLVVGHVGHVVSSPSFQFNTKIQLIKD